MSRRYRKGSALCLIVLSLFIMATNLTAQSLPDARGYYERGLTSLQADDPYAAVDSFRSAIRLNPAYAEARLGMAEALFLLTEYDEAYREIEEARKYASGRRDLILLEARILTALREYDPAAGLYQNLLKYRPHDGDANRGLAEIYALLGQRELAEEAFDLSLHYSPGDRRALLQLVLLHDEEREKKQAESALNEALRLFPDNLEVRIQAAEHYALYSEWKDAIDQLDRAKAMVSATDARYRRVGLIDAELSLQRGDAASALSVLEQLENQQSTDTLYLMARAFRELGNEEMAQDRAGRLLRIDSEDEIARMFRENYLFLTAEGFREDRIEAASWHLEKGRRFEENFYYQRAYASYRRARLLAKDLPEAWIAYTNLIRKMGFPEHYVDSLRVALENLPVNRSEYAVLKRRLDLLEHSDSGSLGSRWGISDPWTVGTSAWNLGVYVYNGGNSLPIHNGSQDTLALYFADIVDATPDLRVFPLNMEAGSVVESVDSFPEAFRDSREKHDYFVMLRFAETERTFSASCELYLSRTGELVGRYEDLRTGQGRVADTLYVLADAMSAGIPRMMEILSLDGERVLLDKGRWQGISAEEPWVVIRGEAGRPAIVEGGLEYKREDYLGSIEIQELSEPLSEARYIRSGDFDFIRAGDKAFLLPVPEEEAHISTAPDPAFRARLLSIP